MHKTILFLSFLLITKLSAGAIGEQNSGYRALMHQFACARSEDEAISAAGKALKDATAIDSRHLYAENIYIRHAKNRKGEFCVEGVMTQKGLSLFDAELDEEYESIMGEIEDLNDGTSFAQKEAEVDVLLRKVEAYNQKLSKAQQFGSLRSKRINQTKSTLSGMINAVPLVRFQVSGCEGKLTSACPLQFISYVEDDSSNAVYRWEFGDGSVSMEKDPSHVYKTPGNYLVSLRVTDEGEKYAVFSSSFTIEPKPKEPRLEKPVASFSTDRELYAGGEEIRFVNLSSAANSDSTHCFWDFGDGSSSNLCQPQHSYRETGLFSVRLAVENSAGMRSEAEKSLRIVHPAIIYASEGQNFDQLREKFGEPEKSLAKDSASTQAYRYGEDWLLVKYNKVECRIKGDAFRTNLVGGAKDCHWYVKHAETALFNTRP